MTTTAHRPTISRNYAHETLRIPLPADTEAVTDALFDADARCITHVHVVADDTGAELAELRMPVQLWDIVKCTPELEPAVELANKRLLVQYIEQGRGAKEKLALFGLEPA